MKELIDGRCFAKDDLPHMGGKAAPLAALEEFCLPIPPWFVVTADAYVRTSEAGTFPRDFLEALDQLLDAFPQGTRFAVRSSALAEDGTKNSFAGQFESYLWVAREDVPGKIREVWASAFSPRVKAYCDYHKLEPPTLPPAVLVQQMVKAQKAGVAFGADPIRGDTGSCVIGAVFGLGSALVDGSSDSDTYTYRYLDGAITAKIALKDTQAEKLNRLICPDYYALGQTDQRVLGDEEIAQIARLVKETSQHFGRYQDIEWACEGKKLYILQSRPITTLEGVFEADARAYLFDNSNIAESYRGTTTPLTFTFIRKAYTGVYEQFCRVFGVSEAVLGDNAGVFSRMLAFVDNRVYYNLHSWYKMLSLLPGYALNRTFMEQMMGVKEPLPPAFLQEIHDSVPKVGKGTDTLRLIRCLLKLLGNYIMLERHIARFYRRLDTALAGPSLELLDANALADAFAAMEKSLLKRWDAPIENDFFAMIFHGLLRSLCKKYKLPEDFHNSLLTGQGGIISAQPAREIGEIGQSIAGDSEAVDCLARGSLREINRYLAEHAGLRAKTEGYLGRFGDRCVDELKLESTTLTENPLPFYRAVAVMAAHGRKGGEAAAPPAWKPYFKGHPLRRLWFGWVLKNARRLVKNRENLRFERTRLFGRVRSLFLQLGLELASRGALEDRRDVFYLTLEELLGGVDATAACYDLEGTVALRRQEHQRNGAKELPTRVTVNGIAGFSGRRTGQPEEIGGGDLQGLPCCAGVVEGVARVVEDPQNTDFAPGQILVAHSTDPGWIVLFTMAAGIIVEKGSLLSHAAIVSREMGIPCIVSAQGATAHIPDGATVKMDGATGSIQHIQEVG